MISGRLYFALAVAFSTLAAASGDAGAAMVRYSFTGAAAGPATPGTTTFAPESPAANITFSALSVADFTSPGVVASFVGGTDQSTTPYSFDGKGFEAGADLVPNTANPPSSSFYLQFTVTPQAGTPVTLNNVSADFGFDETTGSGGTTFNYNLYYSTDGTIFTKVGTTTSIAISGNSNVHAVLDDVSKDLTGAFPQPITNLSNPNGVTFRLAMADNNSGVATKRMFIDDIALNDSPVPEPASIGLFGIGAAMLLGRRRRLA